MFQWSEIPCNGGGSAAGATCPRPLGWCAHAGAVYEFKDCDGDGIPDHTCSEGDNYGVIQSANNCADSWPNGSCLAVCDNWGCTCQGMSEKYGVNHHTGNWGTVPQQH